VKKDKGVFDQFTGATITPRAVTAAVYQALRYYEQHQKKIWADPPAIDDKESNGHGNG
jgi:electron transport complex protein RnfG